MGSKIPKILTTWFVYGLFYFTVTSCLDLRREGRRRSGIYEISFGEEKKSVFCDMSTLGTIQKLLHPKKNFDFLNIKSVLASSKSGKILDFS